jgi:ammonia channel protein AmtB
MIFTIGFILFEYGSSRPKNARSVLIKHPFLLAISSINSFIISFGIAYGNPRLIGSTYYLNINVFTNNNEYVGLNFMIFTLTCYLTSALGASSINE